MLMIVLLLCGLTVILIGHIRHRFKSLHFYVLLQSQCGAAVFTGVRVSLKFRTARTYIMINIYAVLPSTIPI
jgi:hypothetical protein